MNEFSRDVVTSSAFVHALRCALSSSQQESNLSKAHYVDASHEAEFPIYMACRTASARNIALQLQAW